MLHVKLGIIGCGNMGEAIVKGITTRKIINKRDIYVSDKKKIKATNLKKRYGVNAQSLNSAIVKKTKVIILAVKPQDAQRLLDELRYFIDKSDLIISIMAGIKTNKIQEIIGKSVPVVRVMPNMAALVGESMSAVSYNVHTESKHKNIVRKIFSGIGEIIEIPESMQDAFTALVGSGPAYFFYIVECFLNAARKQGFSRKQALQIITQTIKGSAKVLGLSGATPELLRQKVTSKGGSTEAAMIVFSKKALKHIILNAVQEAAKRSKELSL